MAAFVLPWRYSCDREVLTNPEIFTNWLFQNVGIHSASSFPKLRLRTRDKEETLVMTTAGDACCLCDGPALFSEAGTCSGRVLYLI